MSEMNNELYHYGVVGMKWGVRRARKKGGTYTYKSHGTKKYEKKAAKATTRSEQEKYISRAKRSADIDRRMQKSAQKVSTGKAVAKKLVLGWFGDKTYEVAKATGYNQLASAGISLVSTYIAGPLGNWGANALLRSEYASKNER